MLMLAEGFPSCCGATILHYLGVGVTKKEAQRHYRTDMHIALAITEKSQRNAIEVFKELGWVPIRRFRNRRLTLWISPRPETKIKKSKKRV